MLDGGDDGSGGGGHQKPPKATQFQRGQSGNPNGRPKGSKNLVTLIKQAAYDKIVVNSKDGKKRHLTRIEAGLIQLSIKAAQGDTTAIQRLTDLVDEVEKRAAAARPPEVPIGEKDLAVLREVHARMRACEIPDEPPTAVEA